VGYRVKKARDNGVREGNMKKRLVLIEMLTTIYVTSCTAPNKTNVHEERDKKYDFSQARTIGFIPYYENESLKKFGMTEEMEKSAFNLLGEELKKQGYRIIIYTYNDLVFIGERAYLKPKQTEYPDIIVNISIIQLPVQEFTAKDLNLRIFVSFWTGQPEYNTQVCSFDLAKRLDGFNPTALIPIMFQDYFASTKLSIFKVSGK
jgi:hypothetical protein